MQPQLRAKNCPGSLLLLLHGASKGLGHKGTEAAKASSAGSLSEELSSLLLLLHGASKGLRLQVHKGI